MWQQRQKLIPVALHLQVRAENVKSMIASPSRPPRSPSSASSPHTHGQTGPVSRASSVSSLQPGTAPQPHAALPKGPATSSAAVQQPVPGTAGRQGGASHSSAEFSELENKEALKRPAVKKGGPVLRRVQSECLRSPGCISEAPFCVLYKPVVFCLLVDNLL